MSSGVSGVVASLMWPQNNSTQMTMHTNPQQLERWLGVDAVNQVSRAMRTWYGPPIALRGVPGKVYACAGGDFTGRIRAGYEASARDRFDEIARRLQRGLRVTARRHASGIQLNAGFASLSDLISEATVGAKRREFAFQKTGSTGVQAVTNSLWRAPGQPSAGAAGSAAPGGRALDDSIAGAFPFVNPSGGDTQHFVAAFLFASSGGSTLLLYDRLFDVAKTMNSTATEAVTGVPTRYQNTAAGNPDYVGGNFLFVEVGGTPLAATAHNWTVCTYTDQAGAASTLPSLIGNSAAIVDRLDHPAGQWFAPLEAGDVGIKALTQMQASALVATGLINFVIGHPLAWMPCPQANLVCAVDGINTAFNLVRIFDDAALSFLEVTKPSATAANFGGSFTTVAG